MTDEKTTKLEPAAAHRVADLVDVAPGAIVSRVLARSGGGSMTLFAFDEGQSLDEHTAPFDAVVHVLDGALELRIGGEAVRTDDGQVTVMPANVPHALRALRPTRMLLTMLREPQRTGE